MPSIQPLEFLRTAAQGKSPLSSRCENELFLMRDSRICLAHLAQPCNITLLLDNSAQPKPRLPCGLPCATLRTAKLPRGTTRTSNQTTTDKLGSCDKGRDLAPTQCCNYQHIHKKGRDVTAPAGFSPVRAHAYELPNIFCHIAPFSRNTLTFQDSTWGDTAKKYRPVLALLALFSPFSRRNDTPRRT